jgi:anti-sigma-K factor RskA
MEQMSFEHVTDLIPGYALGALDPEEEAQVEAHLAGCDVCQHELAQYEEVVGLMALALPQAEPAPDLKERLARGSQAAVNPPGPISAAPATEPSWSQRLDTVIGEFFSGPNWRPALAILVLILVISNVFLLLRLNQESRSPFDDPDSPWRRPVIMAGSEAFPEAAGIIYISGDGKNGTLVVNEMPLLASDEEYQLWLIRDGQRTSGAVFSVNEEGYRGVEVNSPLPLSEYEAFGITIEPAGGSPQPTGERVLGYNLD